MDLFRQGMKGPSRPAPGIPQVNRYSPVTNWQNDPFGADVFEPMPHYAQKKQPPPRPPPPKIQKQPEVPLKPSHFIRRPTVLTSLLSRRNTKTAAVTNHTNSHVQTTIEYNNEVDATRMFPKCEPKNIQTATLIDLSSPPSSPTFTTRSSSDGLSVDSFGSDATTSTNHHNMMNGGSASQAESGFEDDFDLFLHARKPIAKDDTLDDFTAVDPFSPQPSLTKPPLLRKPVLNKDLLELSNSLSQSSAPSLNGPTIIRAKPARPKPPDNSALLKNTFGNIFPATTMNINTTTPIHKVSNGFGDSFDSKPICWDDERSSERESSPPMPSIPPPPPPVEVDDDLPVWADDLPGDTEDLQSTEEPHAYALFDYFTSHQDDLCFSVNARITLLRRVDDEWYYGRLRSGAEGLFPANYVDVKVPLPNEPLPRTPRLGVATAMYDFDPVQSGDLRFQTGDSITVMYKINDEWYFGECNGAKGQFPSNYVQMN